MLNSRQSIRAIVGNRLRGLRYEKRLSQGDVDKRSDLLLCCISHVESGHTVPSLETLENLAKALEIELYQLFFVRKGKHRAPKATEKAPPGPRGDELLKPFTGMSEPNQRLLLDMTRKLASVESQV